MKYFAYGSNMSLPRLTARLSGAKRIDVVTLAKHTLRFHKVSTDGSGKCDAFFTGNPTDCVIGALFEISDKEKDTLDRIEGLGRGYENKVVLLTDAQGKSIETLTYYATITHASLLPYSWYLTHVLYGAEEAAVPADYLGMIKATRSIEDPDRKRDARERAIYNRQGLDIVSTRYD